MKCTLYNIINNKELSTINVGKLNRKQVMYAIYSKSNEEINKLVEDGLVGVQTEDGKYRGNIINLHKEEGFEANNGEDKRRFVRISIKEMCNVHIGGNIQKDLKVRLTEIAYGSFVFESNLEIPNNTDVVLKILTTNLNCYDGHIIISRKINRRLYSYVCEFDKDTISDLDSMESKTLYSYILKAIMHEV